MTDPIPATELTEAETWLHTVLTGDTTLAGLIGDRAYAYEAPPGATMPYIVFLLQSAVDRTPATGVERIWTSCLYAVKVIGETRSSKTLAPIAARMDKVLNMRRGSTDAADIDLCLREQAISYPEETGGRVYHHLGGSYRINVHVNQTPA